MPAPPVEYVLLDVGPELPDGRRRAVGCGVRLPGVGALRELGHGAPPRPASPTTRDRGGRPPPPARCRPIRRRSRGRPPARSACSTSSRRPRGQGSNDWVIAGLADRDRQAAARERPAPARACSRARGSSCTSARPATRRAASRSVRARHPARHDGAPRVGRTNVSGDVQDLYLERLNDERHGGASYEDAWEPLTIHREEIRVRGTDEPVVVEVRETRHGPILETLPRSAGCTPSTSRSSRRDVRAPMGGRSTAASVRRSSWSPSRVTTSRSSADAACGRRVSRPEPRLRRRRGHDRLPVHRTVPDAPAPATARCRCPDGPREHEWDGCIPFDELPWAVDPAAWYLVTANNRIHDDDYPHLIGHDFHAPYRARRIVGACSRSRRRHDVASWRRIQADTVSLPASAIAPVCSRSNRGPTRSAHAIGLLAGWDARHAARLRGGAPGQRLVATHRSARAHHRLGDELFRRYHTDRELFRCEVLPALAGRRPHGAALTTTRSHAALVDALAELRERLGPDPAGWRWGALHRSGWSIRSGAIPGLEPLFIAADAALGGDEQTVAQGGFDGRRRLPRRRDPVVARRLRPRRPRPVASGSSRPGGRATRPRRTGTTRPRCGSAGELHPLPFTRPARGGRRGRRAPAWPPRVPSGHAEVPFAQEAAPRSAATRWSRTKKTARRSPALAGTRRSCSA